MDGRPLILAVDDDAAARGELDEALRHRYGSDYLVVAAPSGAEALELLESARREGRETALVIADQWMPGMTGSELLARVPALDPRARRALLVAWGDRRSAPTILQGCAFGRLDNYLLKPWSPPEVHLYPAIGAFLAEWTQETRPGMEILRVVGPPRDPRVNELRELLGRNGIPAGFHDPASEAGRALLQRAGLDGDRLPVVILLNDRALVAPTNAELADALGFRVPRHQRCDVAIVGAGPGGLAAAVYCASEGLDTVVLEREAVGGQAGMSSLIRNYLGFPRGITGAELAQRAYEQAWLFGTRYVFGREAVSLRAVGAERLLELSDGSLIAARAVLVATGARYKRLGLPRLERFEGQGVFYTSLADTRVTQGHDMFVVGGGNSAGQAVVHLARSARRVTLLVRGPSLGQGMSDYLVQQIVRLPNVEVRLEAEIADADGEGVLRELTLRDRRTGREERVPAEWVFVLIGAEPHTDWLEGTLERDRHGFLLTGRDAPGAGSRFETSLPGVFAVGDVRAGSVKRLTSAVGEGAAVVPSLHEYLAAHERPAEAQDARHRWSYSPAGAPH